MPSRPADPHQHVGHHFTEAEIVTSIADVARQHLDWNGTITLDLPLVETFELDSLRQLTLVIALEDRFRLKFDEEDEASLTTVGDLVTLIRRKSEAA